MASYGTVKVQEQDVEARMQQIRVNNSLSELLAEVKFGRSLMMMGLFVTCLMCACTFTMVVLATNYSKDTVVIGGVMTEKATNNVVATAEHMEVLSDPLSLQGAQGVKRITISKPDGSIISHKVDSASRVSCKGQAVTMMDVCSEDGFHYLFETARGVYSGVQTNAGLKFQLLDDISVDSVKALATRPTVSKATGKGGL